MVIVYDVVLCLALSQMATGPEPEREGFGKAACAHTEVFVLIQRRGEVTEILDLEEMFRIVQIQAGQFVEVNARRKLRVGGTRQHIYPVTEFLKGMAEVFNVNPLPPAGWISSVRQQADPKGAIGARSSGGIGSCLFQRE